MLFFYCIKYFSTCEFQQHYVQYSNVRLARESGALILLQVMSDVIDLRRIEAKSRRLLLEQLDSPDSHQISIQFGGDMRREQQLAVQSERFNELFVPLQSIFLVIAGTNER